MKKPKVVSIMNLNGGVAKSTVALNLAKGFANEGFKVCVMDLDVQATTTDILSGTGEEWTEKERSLLPDLANVKGSVFDALSSIVNANSIDGLRSGEGIQTLSSAYEVLTYSDDIGNRKKLSEIAGEAIINSVYMTEYPNINLIPSTTKLAQVDEELRKATFGADVKKISRAIESEAFQKLDYDVFIIDTAPTQNLISLNAVAASDMVIVPMGTEKKHIRGMITTVNVVWSVANRLEKDIDLWMCFAMKKNIKEENESIQTFTTPTLKCSDGKVIENDIAEAFFKSTIRYQAAPARQASNTNQFLIDMVKKDGSYRYAVSEDYHNLYEEVKNELSVHK